MRSPLTHFFETKNMKYSEDTEEHCKANIDYINQRWKQLYGLAMEFSSEEIKYLFLVNSGAAIAVLAFHGSVAAVRDMVWPKIMLECFVLGVIFVGLLHIFRHKITHSLFKSWQGAVNDYYSDKRGWSDILDNDVDKATKFSRTEYLAYASFACFVVGASIGMFNFSTLSSGENHVGKEALTAVSTSTKTNDTAASAIDRQNIGRGAEKISDAKHASPSTNASEKVKSVQIAPVSGVRTQ